MATSTQDSFFAPLARLALWVFGILSLVMAIGVDDGSVKHFLRISTAIFCFGLLMSMTLKRLLPDWRILYWGARVVAITSGLVAVGLKLYELLEASGVLL